MIARSACASDYEEFDFLAVSKRLQAYCSEELGAFYLDVLKDRLYTTGRAEFGQFKLFVQKPPSS